MKKIKRYIFCFIVSLMAIFVANELNVKADSFWDNADVVFNADSNGNPTGVFAKDVDVEQEDGTIIKVPVAVQYTRSRDIEFSFYSSEDISSSYNEVTVCEVIPEGAENNTAEKEYCSIYEMRPQLEKIINDEGQEEYKFVVRGVFQLRGIGDGEKQLVTRFNSNDGKVNARTSQSIFLDTTGPVITLKDGEYVYLPAGTDYKDPGATCTDDSDILLSSCKVEWDNNVKIDKNKEGYQYIMYTATDFLGNQVNVTRKILVERIDDGGGISLYWILSGIVVLMVGAFLVYIVVKNKEKQRNQSVL